MAKFLLLPLTLLSLFVAPLLADEPIVILLTTEAKRLPVYLAPWTKSKGPNELTNNHIQELLGALCFDLDVCGSLEIAGATKERAAQAAVERELSQFDAARWKSLGLLYLVRGEVTGKSLVVTLHGVAAGRTLATYTLPLSGSLPSDRRQIHTLSDAIHKTLFGKEGIAKTRILYTLRHPTTGAENWDSEVWIADYDGHNAAPLTREGSYCVTPTFLPPASGKASGSFLYTCYRVGQSKIYAAPLSDGLGRRLITLRGNQLMPVVSKQRDKIAFVSDAGGNPDLFIQPFTPETGAIGKPTQVFSAPHGAQASPSFSPDGKRLAFASNKDGQPRIYIMDLPKEGDSSKPTPKLITLRNRENTSPAWSPDGTKIAYSALSDGVRQIWIYDLQTDRESQLTTGPGHKENPSWAPDSLHLVFNSATVTSSDLYLVNLNQPSAIQITSGPGEKRFPSWEPQER